MPCHILDLADELLNEVLFSLVQDGRALHDKSHQNGSNCIVHRHAELGEASDLDRWRLVCKRFMRIGTPRKFERFILRFSEDGFRRLDDLVKMQLACYVKSVTYLVRPFYQGSEWTAVLQELARENHTLTQLHNRRLREQKTLIETNHDLEQLRIAMTNCSSLQEIKLLRLQDEADEQLIDFIERHTIQNTQHQSRFDWGSACSRAVMNLSIALLGSRCTSIRFIGPQISPETSLQLFQVPSTTLADLGSRLTSLDISFPSHGDITTKIARLSGVLGRFFGATKSLVSIHIGFPKAPLNLELDAIFHGIGWKTLRTLSLEGWRLADHEIIALARRHRRMLRELRLCAVYLRPGGRWRDVLCVLREEMERLDGLDLRDIDYEEHSMAISAAYGVEVFDVQSSASFPSSLPRASPPERRYSNPRSGILPSQTNQRGFRRDLFAKVRDLALDDLGDDGIQVHQDQIRLWEAWVLSGTRGMFNGHSRPYGS